MFTGLIEQTGTVKEVEESAEGVRLRVATPLAAELERGDSIAVSGICLTAVESEGDAFAADVMRETLERSSLGALREGDQVNLELPLRVGDRLGGHFVQGHVDAVGEVEHVAAEGFARRARLTVPSELRRYLREKGSVAVDGVSLTIAAVGDGGFEVALIPETLERTTLGRLRAGEAVNIEVDVLAKYAQPE